MKKREVKYELLRILCMYMIVVGHCLFHGRVTAKLGFGTANYFLDYLVQAFSVVHVNTFVMIGGYFAVDKEFHASRLGKLWKQVAFYSVLIFLICGIVTGVTGLSWNETAMTGADAVKAILPISFRTYWFASVYMGLLVLMPFVNMLATKLTKLQYRYLLAALALFLSVNHMIFRVDTYGIFSGRDLPWFVFLVLLAGYVKLHMKEDTRYAWYGFAGYVISSLAVLASVYLSVKTHQEDIGYFLNYNSPLALCSTLALFICVKNIRWRETKLDGLILKVASAAFGVYLIHDNYLIRYLVWDTFRVSKVARTHWAMIYAVVVAVIVYMVCTGLELIRQQLVQVITPAWKKTLLYKKEQDLYAKIDKIFNGLS